MLLVLISLLGISSKVTAADPDVPDDTIAGVAAAPVADAGVEKFVPNITPVSCSGTLELLKSAEINSKQIRVRQVCRWSETDSTSFGPIADLVIDQVDGKSNRKISLDEVRSTLTGAGVNLGLVRFAGSTTCLIIQSDIPEVPVALDDRAVVKQWIDQKNAPAVPAAAPPVPAAAVEVPDPAENPVHTLRDLLLQDVAQRLNVPLDQLQMTFEPKDRTLMNLSEPNFKFDLQPRRVRDLGRVSWDVTIVSGTRERTLEINANARRWQHQQVLESAAAYRQVIRDSDISEHRVLVDHLPDDPLLTRSQIIGQQAARDLKPGTVLTARLIDPVPLARVGQYVTVTLDTGTVKIRTVAKALESGSFGQTIKVRSEQSKDVFDVTLTGPQQAAMGPGPVAAAE